MDRIDREILNLLSANGRMTHEEIGQHLHLSRPSVHQRVARLEREGILRGYRAVVNWAQLGEKIQALLFVKIRGSQFHSTVDHILALQVPGLTLVECQRLAGEWCLLLKVRVADPQAITALIDQMLLLPAVLETSTTFILTTLLEDGLTRPIAEEPKGSE